jgi:hypothetical protein
VEAAHRSPILLGTTVMAFLDEDCGHLGVGGRVGGREGGIEGGRVKRQLI